MKEAGVLPCYTTFTDQKNQNGLVLNNFQPIPLTGEKAQQVIDWILTRNKTLPDGIQTIRQYIA